MPSFRGVRVARPQPCSPSSSRRRGQSLAEFAIVLPVLITLLFGTVQLGITFGAYNGLINSVREAARFGSVCIGQPSSCGPQTATYLASQKIPGSVFGYRAGSGGAKVEYQAYSDGGSPAVWNVRIRVTGCATGVVFIPLIGSLLGLSDPTALPLGATETFRVEGQPSAAAQAGLAVDPSWSPAYTSGAPCS